MMNRALKVIRQFHGMKQVDLASQLGMSKSSLLDIESGKKGVNNNILDKYSEVFNISASSLVFISESLSKKDSVLLSDKLSKAFSTKAIKIMEWLVEKENKKTKD